MADEQEEASEQAAWYEAAMTVVAAFLESDPVRRRTLWAEAADRTVEYVERTQGGAEEGLERLRAELSVPDETRARGIALETAHALLESRRQHGIHSLDDIHSPDELAYIRGTLIGRGDEEGLAKIDRMVLVERFLDGLEAGEAAAS